MINKYILFILSLLKMYPLESVIFVLFVLNVVLFKHLYVKHSKKQLDINILELVQQFYLYSYLKSILVLCTYFLFNIGILFILRLINLGSYNNIYNFTFNLSFNIFMIVLLICCLISLLQRFLYKSSNKILFKLYLYFYSIDHIKDYLQCMHFYYNETWSNEFVIKIYCVLLNLNPERLLFPSTVEEYKKGERLISYEILIKIRKIIEENKRLAYIENNILRKIMLIKENWSSIKRYIPNSMLYIIIIYDLLQGILHYTYYGIVIYMIIKIIREIYEYIGTKDHYFIDPILTTHLYKERIPLAIMENERTIREYLSNGYYGEHMTELYTVKMTKVYWVKDIRARNIYIILGTSILSWYLLFNMSIYSTLILTLPLLIMCLTLELDLQIIGESKKKLKKVLFIISTIIMISVNFWVYLTRYNVYYIRETVWSWGIEINQTFTLEEKKDFLYKYLNLYLNNIKEISDEVKGIILSKVTDEDILNYLTDITSIEQIRNYVEYLPLYYFKLENFYTNVLILSQDKAYLTFQQYINNELYWVDSIGTFFYFVFLVLLRNYIDFHIRHIYYDLQITNGEKTILNFLYNYLSKLFP